MELQVAQPLNQWLPHVLHIYATKKIAYPRQTCLITKYQTEKMIKTQILNLIKLPTTYTRENRHDS